MEPPAENALTMAGLARDTPPWGSAPRVMIDWIRGAGYRSIVLDASMPGLRGRDLDRSARRDLASVLRRHELAFMGMDLWIPAAHFSDSARIDHAIASTLAAIELTADLGRLLTSDRPTLSVTLPGTWDARELTGPAEVMGVVVADHTWPARSGTGVLSLGLDPATVLLAGDDPGSGATAMGSALAIARWSNASPSGRIAPDSRDGSLDELDYRVSLDVAGYARPLVVDLRGLDGQDRIAERLGRDSGSHS